MLFILGTLLLTVLADRLVGSFIEKPVEAAGLIFPPGSTLTYQTPEFSFTAHINRLGFRDREFTLTKEAGTRVLVIGDSFTYGWGVSAEQSWPKVLEASLRERGYDIEVANLGQPGASPVADAQTAVRAIPLLKPDIVIVGITQGDDLAQLKREEGSLTSPARTGGHEAAKSFVRDDASPLAGAVMSRLYPNLLFLLRKRALSRQLVNTEWKSQAESILQALTTEERTRFDRLDREVRERFQRGELNPSLLQGTLKRPDYFIEMLETSRPAVRAMISAMSQALMNIKEVAAGNRAEVVVVSIPYKVYASRRDLESSRRLGLSLVPEMVTSNAASEAIGAAGASSGVRVFDVTEAFRVRADEASMFFELDGHLNPKGHEVFAHLLMPALESYLSEAGKVSPQR
ncbi:MAG: GDSL-type esterase/lipase family protein [Acidobacteria bacterium]|nr:GDSL-type esterase/lipase family protein [Acidobacteriota bacterium]